MSINKKLHFITGFLIIIVCFTLYQYVSNTEIYNSGSNLGAAVSTTCSLECGDKCLNSDTQGCCGDKVYNLKTQKCAQNCATNPAEEIFTRDLKVGLEGADVKELQSFLISKGFLVTATGTSTEYFGPMTKTALSNFQVANNVTEAEGSGYFGKLTRSKILITLSRDLGITDCKLTSGKIETLKPGEKNNEISEISKLLAFVRISSARKEAINKAAYRECEGSGHLKPNSFYRKLNSSIVNNNLASGWQTRINNLADGIVFSVKDRAQEIFDLASQVIPLSTDAMLCACMTPEYIEMVEGDVIYTIDTGLDMAEDWPNMSQVQKTAFWAGTLFAKSELNKKLNDLRKAKLNCKRMVNQCPFSHTHGK